MLSKPSNDPHSIDQNVVGEMGILKERRVTAEVGEKGSEEEVVVTVE